MKINLSKNHLNAVYIILILLAAILAMLITSFFSNPVIGGTGTNVTVITTLNIGNVAPEILYTEIDDGVAAVNLNANTTKVVRCTGLLRDYNNETDIANVTAEFFKNGTSNYTGTADNNYNYKNSTCIITRTFSSPYHGITDDIYLAMANCTFTVQYYSEPGLWNCTIFVNDTMNWNNTNSSNITVNELLALALPSSIDYGTVNSTYVSLENVTNVSNAGNVRINFSLEGYGVNPGDGNAMNCTLGYLKNISVEHEKYNLTATTAGSLTLAQTAQTYTNLTTTPIVKKFDLEYRRDDNQDDAINATYWRIYVPLGVAGTCQGNIVFGATKGPGN